jgi:membrane protein DedA with SNARE-associated domain
MDMETITRFGPAAIALGAFLEGETAVLLAGAGIALGIFDFWTVVFAALAGSLAGDQFFFWLGRLKGGTFLASHPRFEAGVRRAEETLLRHRRALLATYRFIYGLRGVIPYAYGLSDLCWRYFLLANLVTAAFWSLIMTWIGSQAGKFLADPSVAARLPFIGLGVAFLAVAGGMARRRLKSRP